MPANRKRQTGKKSKSERASAAGLRIIPLGGLGEIGKNVTAIEYDDEIIIIDCGMKFPEEEMLGIDFVIPDVEYLVENSKKIKGLFLTHGHEDHIGAIPLIIPRIDTPIYGTALTLGLVENKITDARISYRPKMNLIDADTIVKTRHFEVGFVRVSHSIPDSVGLYVKTPEGVIVHSGDFKIDTPPIGGAGTDLAKLARIGESGVLLLMSDSTNSERPGFTLSESSVRKNLEDILRSHKDRRIVISAFASNLYRAHQVCLIAARFNRKVLLVGRSMIAYMELARKLGYVNIPDDLIITSQEADKISPNRLVVLTTGSQGEPFSGLVLMSKGEHRQIKLGPKDLVVISANPIPGNEKLVSNTINRLFACGTDVIYDREAAIHVSGHASTEELKILISVIKPRYFMPVHGEYRHLVRHGQIAQDMGIPAKNIFVMKNGDVLSISAERGAKVSAKVHAGAIMVDGMMFGEFEGSLLRERKELSEGGLITLSVVLDDTGKLVAPPQMDSRGSVFGLEAESMRPDIEAAVNKALDQADIGLFDMQSLKTEIRKRVREIITRNFRTYPAIIPLVTVLNNPDNPDDAAQAAKSRKRKSRRRVKSAKTSE